MAHLTSVLGRVACLGLKEFGIPMSRPFQCTLSYVRFLYSA